MHWHITVTVNLFFKESRWSLTSVLPSSQISSEQAGKCITGLKLNKFKDSAIKVPLLSTRIQWSFQISSTTPIVTDCVCVFKYQLPLTDITDQFLPPYCPRLWKWGRPQLALVTAKPNSSLQTFDPMIPSTKNHLSIYNSNSFIFILKCTCMTVNML